MSLRWINTDSMLFKRCVPSGFIITTFQSMQQWTFSEQVTVAKVNIPSEHGSLLQRLPNVVQTSWTCGQRWVDVVLTSCVHLVYTFRWSNSAIFIFTPLQNMDQLWKDIIYSSNCQYFSVQNWSLLGSTLPLPHPAAPLRYKSTMKIAELLPPERVSLYLKSLRIYLKENLRLSWFIRSRFTTLKENLLQLCFTHLFPLFSYNDSYSSQEEQLRWKINKTKKCSCFIYVHTCFYYLVH